MPSPFQHSIYNVCDRNRDGSYSTQATRQRMLLQMASELKDLGFRHVRDASDLKAKHADALVESWKERDLTDATMKNRMSALRWLAEKVGKEDVLARDNVAYGIGQRSFVASADSNKAWELTLAKLEQIDSPRVELSLQLQAVFGLRREESLKIQPSWADRGDRLVLKPSWTKGGRPREIPIRTDYQRQVLDAARAVAGNGSMIPGDRSYKQQLDHYKAQCARAHISNVHGLRHQYAQDRYRDLTGLAAPAAGGPSGKDLSPEQRQADQEARMVITEELGHGREQITTAYLGR